MLGSGGAKLIGILAMPMLARLYTPEQFGVFTTFTSMILILAPLITLRFCDAIPLPRTDHVAVLLVYLCLALITAFTILITISFFIAVHFMGTPFKGEPLLFSLILFAVLFLCSMYEVLNMWATRTRSFNVIAKSQITQSFVGTMMKLLMGGLNVKLGLIFGYLLQFCSGNYRLYSSFYLSYKKLKVVATPKRVLQVALIYLRYPKLRLPSNLLMTVSQQSLVLYIAFSFSQSEVGQLGLALSLIAIPTMLFVSTIKKVFYGEIAKTKSKEAILNLTYKFSFRLFLSALVPCLTLCLVGKDIITYFFGNDWLVAGEVVEYLSLYLVFSITVGPLLNIFDVLNKQKAYLFINLIRFFLLICLFLFSYFLNMQFIEVVSLYSIIMCCFFLGIYILIVFILREERVS